MNQQTGPLISSAQPDSLERTIAPSLERRRMRAYAVMVVFDAGLLHLSFALASLLYEGIWWEPRAMLAVQALLPLYLTLALYNAAYSTRALSDWWWATRK